jgi:hypothetical protein
MKVNQINKSKLLSARKVEETEIETEESGDRNVAWLQKFNCCGGKGTDS